MKTSIIHLITPGITPINGGIQTYSRFLYRALSEIYPDNKIRVFIFEDLDIDFCDQSKKRFFHCFGKYSNKLKKILFGIVILYYQIVDRPELLITTHIHFSPLLFVGTLFRNVKRVAVAHGVEAWESKNMIISRSLNSLSSVWSVSKVTKDRLCNIYADLNERVEILYNTFDECNFEILHDKSNYLRELSLDNTKTYLLTVGRLDSREKYKGHDRVIEVLPEVIKKIPSIVYLIVGTGDDRSRLEDLTQKLNLKEYVRFCGRVDGDDLRRYYSISDLFIMPSLGEGFGIVFLEALSSGIPCISGDSDGGREALGDGECGVLVDLSNPKNIVEAILNTLIKEQESNPVDIKEKRRNWVINRFGYDVFRDNITKLIGKL